jgi:hypothetical protein
MDIFRGESFNCDDFKIDHLIQLINYFSLQSLLDFISSKIPIPETFSESIDFIHKYPLAILEIKIGHCLSILANSISQISDETFKQIPNHFFV